MEKQGRIRNFEKSNVSIDGIVTQILKDCTETDKDFLVFFPTTEIYDKYIKALNADYPTLQAVATKLGKPLHFSIVEYNKFDIKELRQDFVYTGKELNMFNFKEYEKH